MITQVIYTDVNNRELDSIFARVGDNEIREIQFIICRNDPPEKVAIPAGVSGQFRMVKSSGNFVVRNMTKTVQEDGTVIFTVAISDQMVNVQGTGYYDIRLSGGGYLYTASGRFIVDTQVISSSVLEDVSEVNGLVFPDDFLTTEDHFAQIDDSIISSSSVWSSFKTNEEIANHSIYSETILYNGAVSSTSDGVNVTLEDSIQNYDIIVFNIVKHTKDQKSQVFYLTSNLTVGQLCNQVVNVNDRTVCFWQYVSNSNILWLSAYSVDVIDLLSIKGLKFRV